jgi:plasmid maintenance system antidote protein VapI
MPRRKNKTEPTFKKLLSPTPLLRRFDDTTSIREIAEKLGVHDATVSAWRAGQQIHWLNADSIAVRLGTHPSELWGDDWSVLETPWLTETNEAVV